MNKIISLNQLSTLLEKLKHSRIVLVGGVFDILHVGHIHFLKQAKEQGDYLMILLESDEKVKKLKGDLRPIHSQSERAEVLESLLVVDSIIPLPYFTTDKEYQELTNRIKPRVIAITQGDPYKKQKQIQAIEVGAKLITIPHRETPSTTQLAKLLKLEP